MDEHRSVPHFEKMLYDDAELFTITCTDIQGFLTEEFLRTGGEIVGWLDGTMTDRERGRIYASQDADVGFDDDGDYFTWTLDEVKAVLSGEESSSR